MKKLAILLGVGILAYIAYQDRNEILGVVKGERSFIQEEDSAYEYEGEEGYYKEKVVVKDSVVIKKREIPVYHDKRSENGPSPYDEGFAKGLEDGRNDAKAGWENETNYKDHCNYSGRDKTDYQNGYSEGYAEGFAKAK